MKEHYTKYLESQFHNPSIEKQYKIIPSELENLFNSVDPLHEDELQPIKGIVHKYENRALIKVSYRCAAHCRFCTRIRQIGSAEGDLNVPDINDILAYIACHPEITDVILSGGDPFFTPKETLQILQGLSKIKSVKVIRIGTRLPIHNPSSFNTKLVKEVIQFIEYIAQNRPFIIVVHVEHPDELTPETLAAIKLLKNTGGTLLSQTVFLKGINDNYETLKSLFENLYWNGIIPYYMYRCDYVKGLEHFVCDMKEEIAIMTKLRKALSGIAYPTYIVDVEGKGKIPVPLDFWDETNLSSCRDFNDEQVSF